MVEYYHGRVLKDDDSSFVYEGGEIFISLFFINIKKKHMIGPLPTLGFKSI